MANKLSLISIFILFLYTYEQITVLGPSSVINKVKDLEDGSKLT